MKIKKKKSYFPKDEKRYKDKIKFKKKKGGT